MQRCRAVSALARRWTTTERLVGVLVLVSLSPQLARAQVGFADLHAHPASHLGFGHRENPDSCHGVEGLFHGSPGLFLDTTNPTATLSSDLGTCNPATHSPCSDTDAVRPKQREAIIGQTEPAGAHSPHGPDSYESWPSAQSTLHQQMHVSALYDAYLGGLRFMIASVTDNELLERWYHDTSYPDGVPRPVGLFSYNSALEQIAFLRSLDDANGWLKIVANASEARAAFKAGQLALVLGVELDSLSAPDILDLVDNHGVRSVIPVHLSDNEIGGTAVYSDLFNTLNQWQNGSFLEVRSDPTVDFRLPKPQYVGTKEVGGAGIVSVQPIPLDPGPTAALNYDYALLSSGLPPVDPNAVGHVNSRGLLDEDLIKELLRRSVLVDVAHMSKRAVDCTLWLAEQVRMPVIDSHTGVRSGVLRGGDERAITEAQALRIAQLGGAIGLGTEGTPPDATITAAHGALARVSGTAPEWRMYPRDAVAADAVEFLEVRIANGERGLPGPSTSSSGTCTGAPADLLVVKRDGTSFSKALKTAAQMYAPNAIYDSVIDLRAAAPGLHVSDIAELRIGFTPSSCRPTASWDIAALSIAYRGGAAPAGARGGLLVERRGVPYRTLVPGTSFAKLTVTPSLPERRDESLRTRTVKHVRLIVATGDDLRDEATLTIERRDAPPLSIPLKHPDSHSTVSGGFGTGNTATVTFDTSRAGLTYGDIEAVYLTEASVVGYDAATARNWDNWDLATVRLEAELCTTARCDYTPLTDYAATELRGQPTTFRFTQDLPGAAIWRGLSELTDPAALITVLDVSTRTGQDNAEAGTKLDFVLRTTNGTEQVFPLKRIGSVWTNFTDHKSVPFFPTTAVRMNEVLSYGIRSNMGGGISGDNWNIDSFVVRRLADPGAAWLDGYDHTKSVISMGAQGVLTIGTDFNGIATQMPFLLGGTAGSQLAALAPGFAPPRDNTFHKNIDRDGLAHVGMLPAFILKLHSYGRPSTFSLLNAASEMVALMERADARAKRGLSLSSATCPF